MIGQYRGRFSLRTLLIATTLVAVMLGDNRGGDAMASGLTDQVWTIKELIERAAE